MMEKLLIVGAGGFGRVVSEFTRENYECFFLDDGKEINEDICGIKVLGKTSDLKALRNEFHLMIVAIGDNHVREKLFENGRKLGYEFPNILGRNVYISPFAKVGIGCIFENNVCIQNGSKVGNGVILNPGVEIHHDSEVGNYSVIYTNSVIRTYAKVGNLVKIGSNVTISNDQVIQDESIVGDGTTID